jgi:HEAT repeat protein
VDDVRPGVRRVVAEALGEIGDADALARLQAQVEVERDPIVKAALEGAVEQLEKGTTQIGE